MAEVKMKWGKPKIEAIKLVNGAIPTGTGITWIQLENPKDGTTTLSVTEGNKQEAITEGGEVIATRKHANKYTLKTTLFDTGGTKPIEDTNGVVDGEYAVRITPEAVGAKGRLIERASVSLMETYTPTDGVLWEYTFEGLKPETGDIVKEYNPA